MISLIAAMGRERVIGVQNRLPWRLPADMRYFKRKTLGKPVIMGRKTYESIGRALPERRNIVISRQPDFVAPGCEVVASLAEALRAVAGVEEAVVIGGGTIYELALPFADKLYLTLVDHAFAGDAYFPAWNQNEWREVSREPHSADAENPYAYCFVELERLRG